MMWYVNYITRKLLKYHDLSVRGAQGKWQREGSLSGLPDKHGQGPALGQQLLRTLRNTQEALGVRVSDCSQVLMQTTTQKYMKVGLWEPGHH